LKIAWQTMPLLQRTPKQGSRGGSNDQIMFRAVQAGTRLSEFGRKPGKSPRIMEGARLLPV
jgi:hypothetical protein